MRPLVLVTLIVQSCFSLAQPSFADANPNLSSPTLETFTRQAPKSTQPNFLFSLPLSSAFGQAPSPLQSAVPGASAPLRVNLAVPVHRFADRENVLLFAAVGASRTLDYFSTLNMRRRGLQEVFLNNDTVDNHAAFAVIEGATTAVSIGAAYLFHRYHHHRLERWTSIVHASLSTTGAIRNYCLQTAHPVSVSPVP